ncbi:MAG: hypothetical protein ACOCWP_03535, partial [Halanaerobium sp.]
MGFILTVLAAALLTAANYFGSLYFLSWTAFLPLFYYLYIYSSKLSSKKIFLTGWNFGFWIFVFCGNFLYHSIKLYTSASILTIILLLILLFLLLSLIYGIFFLLYFYLQQRLFAENSVKAFFFAFCWTLFEVGRYYLLNFFPIGNPAYTQVEFISFIQLAELGGIWLLTFLLVLVNGLLFQIIFEQKIKKIIIIGILVVLIFSFAH